MARVGAAAARPPGRDDAILGLRPETVLEPATVEEARDAMGEAARGRMTLAFIGGGTDLEIGTPPARLDTVVRTGRLRRVIEYSPADQIIVAEAGIRLSELQRTLAEHRQILALDPPLPDRATLGGVIAANAFGPRRARFGSVRDHLIGVSLIRADGILARGGSKVVKNVAGFDLPRLMVGSLGTLGLLATATLRLHPRPATEATLLLPGRRSREVRELVCEIRDAQLEPTSVVAAWQGPGRLDVAVRFEGFGAGVAEQRDRFASLVGRGTGAACELLGDAEARALWERHDLLRSTPSLRAKLTAPPASIEIVSGEIAPPLLDALEDAAFLWYATLGIGFLSGKPASAETLAAAVGSARVLLGRLGGTLTLQAAPASVRSLVDVWGPAPAALPLMRRVKERFDPERRLSPGRLAGGI